MTKNFNKYEVSFLFSVTFLIIIISIIFNSNWFATINGLLGLFSIFLQAKRLIWGQICGLIDCICYAIFSLQHNYLGEFIVHIIILLPIYIFGIIEWKNHKDQENKILTNKLKKKDINKLILCSFIILVVSYCVLTILNSDLILLNTLSIYTLTYSNYLLSKRIIWGFAYYLANEIILLFLWGIPLIYGDMSLLPYTICVIAYFICDIYGIINWRQKKI